jgi:hypothetical protein
MQQRRQDSPKRQKRWEEVGLQGRYKACEEAKRDAQGCRALGLLHQLAAAYNHVGGQQKPEIRQP